MAEKESFIHALSLEVGGRGSSTKASVDEMSVTAIEVSAHQYEGQELRDTLDAYAKGLRRLRAYARRQERRTQAQ